MWDALVRAPLGSNTQRKFVTFIASLLVACFGYILVATPSVNAIGEAEWSGDNTLSHKGRDYNGPKTANNNDKSSLPEGTIYFSSYDETNIQPGEPAVGYLIYFSPGTELSEATRATYRQADFDMASGQFSNLTEPEDIDVDASTWGAAATLQPTTCDVDGLGWIVCPVSGYIAKGMDYLYSLLTYFLEVAPITGGDNSIYQMWNIVKSLANICFIIAFLIIIYAQISGAFVSNYTIKKMLPRLVIAAVLVNTSYWICSIAVDLSNVLGGSVQDVFKIMQEKIGAANSEASELTWETATAYALGGGGIALGLVGLAGATSFGGGALAFLIIAALIPAMFAVFVAVAVLAARQALITVLIVLSPLAFVAYLLPNTEDMFRRWRKLFMNLLIIFPAFSVIFGASQLTGVLIIQNANIFPVVILGLLVQVAPLFITPFLIKLSSGLFSTIAGLTNDKSKGVFDRAKNWSDANREYHKSRAMRKGLDPNRFEGSKAKKAFSAARPTSLGSRIAMSEDKRKRRTAANMSMANARYNMTRGGKKTYDEEQDASSEKHTYEGISHQRYQTAMATGTDKQNVARKALHHQGHVAQGIGDLYQDNMTKHAEEDLQTTIRDDQTLTNIRISTVAHEGLADAAKKRVEAEASRNLQRTIEGTYDLKQQALDTVSFEKQAETYQTIIKKDAEAAWDVHSQSNQAMKELRIREVQSSKLAEKAEQEYKTLIENIVTKGRDAPDIVQTSTLGDMAATIQDTSQRIRIEDEAQRSAKSVASNDFAEALTEHVDLQEKAAGVDLKFGKERVLAAAKSAVTKELFESTDNFQNTLPYPVASNNPELANRLVNAGTTQERVAYARLLAKNGPGTKLLRETLATITAGEDPMSEKMLELKEMLAADQTFRAAGRDFEVWANNEPDPETGQVFAKFKDATQSLKTWNDISPQRFANMSKPSQLHALKLLQDNDTPERMREFASGILNSTSRDNVKITPKTALERLAADPSADISDLVGAAAQEDDTQ
jgi:hypothetical protein